MMTNKHRPGKEMTMKSLYEQLASSNLMTACNVLNKSIKDAETFFSPEESKHLFDSVVCMIESVSGSHIHRNTLMSAWDDFKIMLGSRFSNNAPPIEVDMALECVEEAVQVLLIANATT